jgi:hypothetical protein
MQYCLRPNNLFSTLQNMSLRTLKSSLKASPSKLFSVQESLIRVTSLSSPCIPLSRIHAVPKQRPFSVSSLKFHENMASSNPEKNNNADFKLESLFSVKDKIALITGKYFCRPELSKA